MEDLQAFSVIRVGEDDERAAAMLIVAGLAAPARPQPAAAVPAPAETAPPGTGQATSPWTLPRWARVGLFATALGQEF